MWTNKTFLYLHSLTCQRSQRGFNDLARIKSQAKLAPCPVPRPLTVLPCATLAPHTKCCMQPVRSCDHSSSVFGGAFSASLTLPPALKTVASFLRSFLFQVLIVSLLTACQHSQDCLLPSWSWQSPAWYSHAACNRHKHQRDATEGVSHLRGQTQCKVTCWFWPKFQMQGGRFARLCHRDVQQTRPLTEQISPLTEQIFSSGANLLLIYNLCTNLCEAWRDFDPLYVTMGCRRISWWISGNAINNLGWTSQKCTFNLGYRDLAEKNPWVLLQSILSYLLFKKADRDLLKHYLH